MPSPLGDDITGAIKRSLNIVDLIGELRVMLTRRGRTFKGLCPFHDDHNPSLTVDPDRQTYKCWSCDAGGDIFDFVMRHERMSFREALELLAQKARITLPERRARPSGTPKKDLYEILRWAEDEFHRCFLQAEIARPARDYVNQRGLSAASVQSFRLGFAPNEWDWLLERARSRRFAPELLEKCGLVGRRSSGTGYYDWFRGRLMFPIRDARGRTIAFGGRNLPGLDADDRKYINSPETAIFSKSEQLYGLDQARDAIVKAKCAVVVEGYTDCMMAHQGGVTHVVGTLGTALGDRHVRELKRYTDRILLLFDGDDPGQKAADRALGFFLSQEIDLRVCSLPDGLDPCDFIRQRGAEEFRLALNSAVDALDFKLRRAGQLFDLSSLGGRRQGLDFVLSAIAALPLLTASSAEVAREMVLDRLGHRLGVRPDAVRRRLRQLRDEQARRAAKRIGDTGTNSAAQSVVSESPQERELLEILLSDPSRICQIAEEIAVEEIQAPGLRRILEVAIEIFRDGQVFDLDSLRLRLEDRELACRASILAETGQEKGAVDRRLVDVLAFFGRRKTQAKTAQEIRWSEARGSEEAQKRFLVMKKNGALSRQRGKQRHATTP